MAMLCSKPWLICLARLENLQCLCLNVFQKCKQSTLSLPESLHVLNTARVVFMTRLHLSSLRIPRVFSSGLSLTTCSSLAALLLPSLSTSTATMRACATFLLAALWLSRTLPPLPTTNSTTACCLCSSSTSRGRLHVLQLEGLGIS